MCSPCQDSQHFEPVGTTFEESSAGAMAAMNKDACQLEKWLLQWHSQSQNRNAGKSLEDSKKRLMGHGCPMSFALGLLEASPCTIISLSSRSLLPVHVVLAIF